MLSHVKVILYQMRLRISLSVPSEGNTVSDMDTD